MLPMLYTDKLREWYGNVQYVELSLDESSATYLVKCPDSIEVARVFNVAQRHEISIDLKIPRNDILNMMAELSKYYQKRK